MSQDLETSLAELEHKIREIKDRMPAHSAKPGMMSELMQLEDERDLILSKMLAIKQKNEPDG